MSNPNYKECADCYEKRKWDSSEKILEECPIYQKMVMQGTLSSSEECPNHVSVKRAVDDAFHGIRKTSENSALLRAVADNGTPIPEEFLQ